MLTDKSGKTVDSWTSDSSAHKVSITWGEDYVLKETKAPAGKSILSEPVTLRINEEGKLIVNGAETAGFNVSLSDSKIMSFLKAGGKGIVIPVATGAAMIVTAIVILLRK